MPLPHPGDLYHVGGEYWLILKPAEPFVDISHAGRLCGWWVWASNQTETMPPMPIFVPRKDLMPLTETYLRKDEQDDRT